MFFAIFSVVLLLFSDWFVRHTHICMCIRVFVYIYTHAQTYLYVCMYLNSFSIIANAFSTFFSVYRTFIFYICRCIDIFFEDIITCFYILKYFLLKIKYSLILSSSYLCIQFLHVIYLKLIVVPFVRWEYNLRVLFPFQQVIFLGSSPTYIDILSVTKLFIYSKLFWGCHLFHSDVCI